MRIGKTAPDFQSDTTQGSMAALKPEFEQHNVTVIG